MSTTRVFIEHKLPDSVMEKARAAYFANPKGGMGALEAAVLAGIRAREELETMQVLRDPRRGNAVRVVSKSVTITLVERTVDGKQELHLSVDGQMVIEPRATNCIILREAP
jgi:hypothetical protein